MPNVRQSKSRVPDVFGAQDFIFFSHELKKFNNFAATTHKQSVFSSFISFSPSELFYRLDAAKVVLWWTK